MFGDEKDAPDRRMRERVGGLLRVLFNPLLLESRTYRVPRFALREGRGGRLSQFCKEGGFASCTCGVRRSWASEKGC